MEKFKKIFVSILAAVFCVLAFAGCTGQSKKEPLDVKRITYLIYVGDRPDVEMYVITADCKVTEYSIRLESDEPYGKYDFFAGELPSEDHYEVSEFKITEESWTSMVNTLTEVNFMNLLEEFSPDDSDDASSYYIRVETADDVHQSGGYNAGGHMDPESRKFSSARQAVDRALNRNVY